MITETTRVDIPTPRTGSGWKVAAALAAFLAAIALAIVVLGQLVDRPTPVGEDSAVVEEVSIGRHHDYGLRHPPQAAPGRWNDSPDYALRHFDEWSPNS